MEIGFGIGGIIWAEEFWGINRISQDINNRFIVCTSFKKRK